MWKKLKMPLSKCSCVCQWITKICLNYKICLWGLLSFRNRSIKLKIVALFSYQGFECDCDLSEITQVENYIEMDFKRALHELFTID